jgi:hypothetical protein
VCAQDDIGCALRMTGELPLSMTKTGAFIAMTTVAALV